MLDPQPGVDPTQADPYGTPEFGLASVTTVATPARGAKRFFLGLCTGAASVLTFFPWIALLWFACATLATFVVAEAFEDGGGYEPRLFSIAFWGSLVVVVLAALTSLPLPSGTPGDAGPPTAGKRTSWWIPGPMLSLLVISSGLSAAGFARAFDAQGAATQPSVIQLIGLMAVVLLLWTWAPYRLLRTLWRTTRGYFRLGAGSEYRAGIFTTLALLTALTLNPLVLGGGTVLLADTLAAGGDELSAVDSTPPRTLLPIQTNRRDGDGFVDGIRLGMQDAAASFELGDEPNTARALAPTPLPVLSTRTFEECAQQLVSPRLFRSELITEWEAAVRRARRSQMTPHDAEDIAQEAVIRTCLAYADGRVNGSIGAYFNTVVERRITDQRRRSVASLCSVEYDTATSDRDHIRWLSAKRAFCTLSESDQAILTWTALGEDDEVIASREGIERAAVRQRRSRAIARLRAASE